MFNHIIPDCFNLILKELDIRSLKNYGVCSKESYSRSKQVKTEYKEKYWENILTFKTVLWADNDEYYKYIKTIKSIDFCTKQLAFKETIILKPIKTVMPQHLLVGEEPYWIHNFALSNDAYTVYKNLKCDGVNDNIMQCKFYINGNLHDKITGDIMKTLRYIYGITDQYIIPFNFGIDNRCLPRVISSITNGSVIIHTQSSVAPELTIEVHTIEESFNETDIMWYNLNRLAFHETHFIRKCNSTIKIKSYFVISHLIFKVSDGAILNMKLYFHGAFSNITLNDTYKLDNYYIVHLAKSIKPSLTQGINFNKMDDTSMEIETTSDNTTFEVAGLHTMPCYITSDGFTGFAFST